MAGELEGRSYKFIRAVMIEGFGATCYCEKIIKRCKRGAVPIINHQPISFSPLLRSIKQFLGLKHKKLIIAVIENVETKRSLVRNQLT